MAAARPVRVLVNMPTQHRGAATGVSRVTFQLLREWVKHAEFQFILRSPWRREDLPLDLAASNLEVIAIQRPRFVALDALYQALAMPFIALRQHIDLIVNADPFGTATGGRARLTIVHDFYYRSVEDHISPRARMTNHAIYQGVLSRSQRIICISDSTRRDLATIFPPLIQRAGVIHWASTLLPGSPPSEAAPAVATPYILIVGNHAPNKNFQLAAKAFDMLHTRGLNQVKLVHVGRDSQAAIAGALTEPSARKAFWLLHDLDDETLAGLYENAECLCIPSLYEGFCLPLLEAQARDCPVICTNLSAMPEIAGDAALLIAPDDVQGLADAMEIIIRDAGVRTDLIAKGHENLKRFSWPRTANAYLQELRDLTASFPELAETR